MVSEVSDTHSFREYTFFLCFVTLDAGHCTKVFRNLLLSKTGLLQVCIACDWVNIDWPKKHSSKSGSMSSSPTRLTSLPRKLSDKLSRLPLHYSR